MYTLLAIFLLFTGIINILCILYGSEKMKLYYFVTGAMNIAGAAVCFSL